MLYTSIPARLGSTVSTRRRDVVELVVKVAVGMVSGKMMAYADFTAHLDVR